MKRVKFMLPVLALLALGFVLSGCPKDKMMQNDSPNRIAVEQIG